MQKLGLIYKFVLVLAFIVNGIILSAQTGFENSPLYKHFITVGGSIGPAHYLGDISPAPTLRFLRPSFQVYAKKTFFPYDISIKFNYSYAFLTAADKFSKDSIQVVRNLDFSTSVHDLSLSIQTSILKFRRYEHTYTIYFSLGIGKFLFNPFTFYENKKVYLRNLGTEGQYSYLTTRPATYSLQSESYPIGIGIQSNKKSFKTWHLELVYRFTNTGYLDDVFSTYAGFESFQPTSNSYNSILAAELQNRSDNIDFGSKGTTRGNGKNDHYFTLNFGMDLQFWRYIYKYRTKYNRIRVREKDLRGDEL